MCVSPKENLIQLFNFPQNWGQQLCNHNGRDACVKKSTVKGASLHSILDNGAKPSQSVFELSSAPLVIEILHYRRYTYQRAWNVAVLIGKTQVMVKHIGQVSPGPP